MAIVKREKVGPGGAVTGAALGTAQVSIRGVGLTIATGAGEPGVAVHLDGAYEARPALSSRGASSGRGTVTARHG